MYIDCSDNIFYRGCSKMSVKHAIHPIKPRRQSKTKWVEKELCTINEENWLSATASVQSSRFRTHQQVQQSKNNIKEIHPLNNRSFVTLLNSPSRINQRNISQNSASKSQLLISNRSKENIRCPTQSQLIVVNNRKFITSKGKSRSKSPKTFYKITSTAPLSNRQQILNQSDVQNHSPKIHRVLLSSKINEQRSGSNVLALDQKQGLYRKIDVLQRRVAQLHREKQTSVVNLLKQNQNLKEQLQRYKSTGKSQFIQQSRRNENISQNMITLSEMSELDSLRQVNLKMTQQIHCLNNRIEHLSSQLAAHEQHKQQRQCPQIIPLPESSCPAQQVTDISKIINQQEFLALNSHNSHNSHNQHNSHNLQQQPIGSRVYQQAQAILRNISLLSEQNSSLHEQVECQKSQLQRKTKKIRKLQQYLLTINNYIRESRVLQHSDKHVSSHGSSHGSSHIDTHAYTSQDNGVDL